MKQEEKNNKVHKTYRLDPRIATAIKKIAEKRGLSEAWVVDQIIGEALGILPPFETLTIKRNIKI